MSREIIFRGKRVDNGEWCYGDLIHNGFDGTSRTLQTGIAAHGCYPIEVIPETVGQFTGRTDVNGVKIWEGDLILHGESKRIIEYRSTNFCATRPSGKESILLSFSTNPKVIGNRFDNPELIK